MSDHKKKHLTKAQVVLRCHVCENPLQVLQMYCKVCCKYLCKACVSKHLSNKPKKHNCPKHSSNITEKICEQCDSPICAICASSKQHKGHTFVSIFENYEEKKEVIEKDLTELEKSLYPMHQEIASNILVQKANLNENSKQVLKAIDKHGEDLHRKIDTIIKNLKADLDEMNSKHLAVLNKQEDEITRRILEISQSIANLKKIKSREFRLPPSFKSRNAIFREIPFDQNVSLPMFIPNRINKKQLYSLFGFLSDHTTKYAGAQSLTQVSPQKDEPRVIAEIRTEYNDANELRSISCRDDGDVWTCGSDSIMRLCNLQKELIKSIQTMSGEMPFAIVITRSGYLAYTDKNDRTVNIVKKTRIETAIILRGWRPLDLCGTSSDDLLVIMESDDYKQTKIARYCGSTEKQIIQFDDKGEPLYSPSGFSKNISENINLDICVSDYKARAVLVVNQAGKLRFTYTGPSYTTAKGPFNPKGITTDSKGWILTADPNNRCIHILDQDGQFLRYINNCDLQDPSSLSVDFRDNLFVAQCNTGTVKKIQYHF
ncbi:uncharacterized protein LOC128159889 [Crassostrea angulata]|uniref:uncharacterized protein LOC128159889 n=1 Tax=Magallana angulata TaxID=2784310 RepID=UPI0022B16C84|nr:uncharacterized protein LOC128159889 [Crassostrea angulata]